MKTLRLPAFVALSAVLAACGGGNGPGPAADYALTVKLVGVSAAPVSVKTGNTVLWNDTVTGTKTFTQLAAGTVVTVKGAAVPGFDVPAEQTVTVNADQTVTLIYTAQRGAAISPAKISGTVTGATFPAGYVLLGNADGVSANSRGTLSASGEVDLKLAAPPSTGSSSTLLPPSFSGCTFTGTSTANPDIFRFSRLYAYSAQGDPLGEIQEELVAGATVPGSTVARIYSTAASQTSGTVDCGNSGSVVYDLDLKAGWNAVEYSAKTDVPTRLTLKSLDPAAASQLKGRLFESFVNVALGTAPLTFAANETVSVAARFQQVGGVSGTVTLSTDVPGLTVEPTRLTLPTLGAAQGQSAFLQGLGLAPQQLDTQLTFRYTGTVPGTLPFRLLVNDSAGRPVGGGYGTLSVQRPGIKLDLGTSVPEEFVCQGETGAIRGQLVSLFGYAGSVTLSLKGLPAGVSAAPVQVTLGANTSTEITLPITVAKGASPTQRDVTIEVSGPGATSSVSLALGVCPQRTLINNGGVSERGLASVSSGVWILTGIAETQTNNSYDQVLKRFTSSGVAATVTLPEVDQLVGLSSGDVVALPYANGGTQAKLVRPDGTFTTVVKPEGVGQAVSDADGRLWYVGRDAADQRLVLARWNPVTGEVAVMDRTRVYSLDNTEFLVSPDGKTLLYLALSTDLPVVVDTVTGAVRDLGTRLDGYPFFTAAIGNDGTIWLTDINNNLNRRDPDGRVSTVISRATLPGPQNFIVIGLDAATPGVLWLQNGSKAIRLETSSLKMTSTPVGRISRMITTRNGGVAVVTYDGCATQACSHLTLLN
ncbi:hypothetical protein [Deinococcus sp. AJ005]|uniref:hypothetical protein n=1 Tax=Deinococcus sp. AJ005 TaxID=2652443 RepID=UPI00125CC166|nr:hypothetical protein [Deinococcus sp. AJ005]QFP77006.1 hypothetical protein DAAJ005_11505 [Deinococcus sp. AJ005]